MRIALYHNLSSGGSKREAYEFAKQMVKHGSTVHLYTTTIGDETFLPLADIAQQTFISNLRLVPGVAGRLPLVRRYVDLMGLLWNIRRIDRLDQEIAARIDSNKYDLVFLNHSRIIPAPFLLRHIKTRSAYYCNEPIREFYEPPLLRPYELPQTRTKWLQEIWYKPAERLRRAVILSEDKRNIRCAQLLLANSYYSNESIYRAHGLRSRVVYLGVDVEKFRPLHLERENFVLSVGAVSPLKGYDFLVQAIGRVSATRRPRLVIVGNTASAQETNFLQGLAREQQVSLEFHVNVAEDELVRLYNRARAFVYAPILEPFGLAPLEAMACETPVVAVKEGGVRESVQEGVTGYLVPRQADEFASALNCLLTDASLARRFGEQGREQILQFWTWEKAYERLMKAVGLAPLEAERSKDSSSIASLPLTIS